MVTLTVLVAVWLSTLKGWELPVLIVRKLSIEISQIKVDGFSAKVRCPLAVFTRIGIQCIASAISIIFHGKNKIWKTILKCCIESVEIQIHIYQHTLRQIQEVVMLVLKGTLAIAAVMTIYCLIVVLMERFSDWFHIGERTRRWVELSRNPETISLRYEHQKVGREIYGPRYFIRTMRYFFYFYKSSINIIIKDMFLVT